MEKKYQWDLSFIYQSEDDFKKDLEKLKALVTTFSEYEGKLSDDKALEAYLNKEREVELLLNKLYSYASGLADLNRKDVTRNAREAEVEEVLNELIEKTSYFEPEVLSLGEEKIQKFLEKHQDCKDFDFYFKKLFLGSKHVLTADKEKLLAGYSPITGVSGDLYSTLTVGDYYPTEVTLSGDRKVAVSTANWTSLIKDEKDPEDRKKIFEGLYKYYDARKNTYAGMYNLGLKAQLANVKARGYSSILESHLEHNQIPTSVYLSLVSAAHEGSAPLKRYYEVRRKALGLTKHRSYDRFLSLAKSEKQLSYEEAKDLFYKSIERFPEDFQKKAHEVSKEGVVDVYPSDGKRTGAYSSGGGGIFPHILLNFLGTLDDAFTLAHESGHSIHTLYSMESQPILKQNYTIFVAEIASTFNEHNLLDYLLKTGDLSKEDKIALLQKEIDEIAATFYRQTLFAEYELKASQLVEEGKQINYQVLSDIMTSLYKDYYEIDIAEEVYKPLVWCYIPHLFYSPFYVYQYATSFATSLELYKRVNNNVPGAFDKYIGLLKSGGSAFPIDQVKAAGVDLTTKEPFQAVVKRMDELVRKLEELLND